jgi:hypothetical protein
MTCFTFLPLLLALLGPSQPPFTIDATQDDSANFPEAPRVQSFSFGQWEGRWVFIGGRIAGYHALGGSSADFSRADANREVWVVDTTVKPARTYHVPVSLLPAKLDSVKDEWQTTGQLYYQDGESLYIGGGYGEDSGGHWVTYPLLTKVDLPGLIDSVMKGQLDADCISFVSSPVVQSAGGELVKLSDGFFYLVMGHVFTGTYSAFEGQGEHNSAPVSQTYLNEIRKLKIAEGTGGALSVKLVQTFRDDTEFHRRDLNVAKFLSPTGVGLAVYGGVFTPDTQLSYTKPVYLTAAGEPHIDASFDQKMNAYNCAKLLVYDPSAATMYTTFFGGISRYAWYAHAKVFMENARSGNKNQGNYLDGMQWSDQISTLRRVVAAEKAETSETVQDAPLGGFVGTDAVFIPIPQLARAAAGTDILDLTPLRGKRTLVGYIYGGIRASPFQFPYNKTAQQYNSGTVPTKPSDLILKVYLQVRE